MSSLQRPYVDPFITKEPYTAIRSGFDDNGSAPKGSHGSQVSKFSHATSQQVTQKTPRIQEETIENTATGAKEQKKSSGRKVKAIDDLGSALKDQRQKTKQQLQGYLNEQRTQKPKSHFQAFALVGQLMVLEGQLMALEGQSNGKGDGALPAEATAGKTGMDGMKSRLHGEETGGVADTKAAETKAVLGAVPNKGEPLAKAVPNLKRRRDEDEKPSKIVKLTLASRPDAKRPSAHGVGEEGGSVMSGVIQGRRADADGEIATPGRGAQIEVEVEVDLKLKYRDKRMGSKGSNLVLDL